jgi:hypothetical protein
MTRETILLYGLSSTSDSNMFNNLGSLSVNVSASTGNGRSEFVNAGDISGSSSLLDGSYKLINRRGIFAVFMHITLICYFVFL